MTVLSRNIKEFSSALLYVSGGAAVSLKLQCYHGVFRPPIVSNVCVIRLAINLSESKCLPKFNRYEMSNGVSASLLMKSASLGPPPTTKAPHTSCSGIFKYSLLFSLLLSSPRCLSGAIEMYQLLVAFDLDLP